MSYQVKYFAIDGRPATREKHTDEKDAHFAARFQSEKLGVAHWVEVNGVVCVDCVAAYEVAKIKLARTAEKVPGLGAWKDSNELLGLTFKPKRTRR